MYNTIHKAKDDGEMMIFLLIVIFIPPSLSLSLTYHTSINGVLLTHEINCDWCLLHVFIIILFVFFLLSLSSSPISLTPPYNNIKIMTTTTTTTKSTNEIRQLCRHAVADNYVTVKYKTKRGRNFSFLILQEQWIQFGTFLFLYNLFEFFFLWFYMHEIITKCI